MRKSTALSFVAVAALAVVAQLAGAQSARVSGRPKLIDGDSFEIGNVGVRLFGVDAPEGRQSCTRNGREWRCGDAALAELRRLVGSRDVACEPRDEDSYGRIVAVCRVGKTDLGAAMVRAGLAVAYGRYSDDYVDEEREARAARRGLWAGEFTAPETYRSEQRDEPAASRAAAQRSTPGGCRIKGNINGAGERIYHTPESASYADTSIDEANGERWFCTEAEARSAGWRAPRRR